MKNNQIDLVSKNIYIYSVFSLIMRLLKLYEQKYSHELYVRYIVGMWSSSINDHIITMKINASFNVSFKCKLCQVQRILYLRCFSLQSYLSKDGSVQKWFIRLCPCTHTYSLKYLCTKARENWNWLMHYNDIRIFMLS